LDVCAVRGNFDDAQTAVKQIFASKEIAAELDNLGWRLSSANSINFGRLLPQIVYYYTSYQTLLERGTFQPGERVNFCVPTGNFGDILAGEYARRMGLRSTSSFALPTATTCSRTSLRAACTTTSPVLQEHELLDRYPHFSNLERLLFELAGRDDAVVRGWMRDRRTGHVRSAERSDG
jgi:threonine synthase